MLVFRLSVLAALVSVTACNMVVTEKPMFGAGDQASAAPIRTGIWRSDKPGCDVDETLSQDKWPACAGAQPGVADPPFWLQVGGEPSLLQMALPIPIGASSTSVYLYAAYRPLKLDAQGRVTALKTWAVQCGPPPKPGEVSPGPGGAAGSGVNQMPGMTRSLLPGLKPGQLGGCTAETAAALRNAAVVSEAWADANPNSHWVRDPIPGDLPPLSQSTFQDALRAGAAQSPPANPGATPP